MKFIIYIGLGVLGGYLLAKNKQAKIKNDVPKKAQELTEEEKLLKALSSAEKQVIERPNLSEL